jgi:hypothetical protein
MSLGTTLNTRGLDDLLRRRARHQRDLRLLHLRHDRQGVSGGRWADDGDHLVLLDQPVHRRDGLRGVRFIVVHDDIDLPPEEPAGFVDVLFQHFRGIALRLAEKRRRPRHREDRPDPDWLVRPDNPAGQQGREQDAENPTVFPCHLLFLPFIYSRKYPVSFDRFEKSVPGVRRAGIVRPAAGAAAPSRQARTYLLCGSATVFRWSRRFHTPFRERCATCSPNRAPV